MGEPTVTVCDHCHTSACWQGIFMCETAEVAGTIDMPISELRALGLEHPDYYEPYAHPTKEKEA